VNADEDDEQDVEELEEDDDDEEVGDDVAVAMVALSLSPVVLVVLEEGDHGVVASIDSVGTPKNPQALPPKNPTVSSPTPATMTCRCG